MIPRTPIVVIAPVILFLGIAAWYVKKGERGMVLPTLMVALAALATFLPGEWNILWVPLMLFGAYLAQREQTRINREKAASMSRPPTSAS